MFDTQSTDSFCHSEIHSNEKNISDRQLYSVDVRFSNNRHTTCKNTTSIFDNQFICFWNDKERLLLDSTQKCPNARVKVQKKNSSDSYVFYSPCYPTVYDSSQNMLVVEFEDNVFESLKPVLPLEGSTKSITERINFASSKAGAISLAKSKGMSGNNEVLSSNKYKYCITTCKSNKWFVFSLPEMVFLCQKCYSSSSLMRLPLPTTRGFLHLFNSLFFMEVLYIQQTRGLLSVILKRMMEAPSKCFPFPFLYGQSSV